MIVTEAQEPRALLAVDLDGTLLTSTGAVATSDRRAVRELVRSGVYVALATGRIAPGTLPLAKELGLNAPCVCADGAVVIDLDGTPLVEQPLPEHLVRELVREAEGPLDWFFFSANRIHALEGSAPRWPWVAGWTGRQRALLRELHELDPHGVCFALGIGSPRGVERYSRALQRTSGSGAQASAFALDADAWAVRVRASGVDKARGLAALAEHLGVPRERVGFLGDFTNDLGALAWAGTSFCMGHAPDCVQRAAHTVLGATSERGGGVAEAVPAWLRRLDRLSLASSALA
jgi:Cof subfamily protein (haloacid dehalogenase superfamily)